MVKRNVPVVQNYHQDPEWQDNVFWVLFLVNVVAFDLAKVAP
ncbi:hypothetical protein [Streptococcus ovuberis]|nr:hypothetical protein [Streptococcus ovuberis]